MKVKKWKKKRRKTSITTKNVKSNIEKNEKENKRKVKHEGKNVEKRREEKIFGKKKKFHLNQTSKSVYRNPLRPSSSLPSSSLTLTPPPASP